MIQLSYFKLQPILFTMSIKLRWCLNRFNRNDNDICIFCRTKFEYARIVQYAQNTNKQTVRYTHVVKDEKKKSFHSFYAASSRLERHGHWFRTARLQHGRRNTGGIGELDITS